MAEEVKEVKLTEEEREQFDTKLDEEQTLAQIKAWEIESQEFSELLKGVIKANLDDYYGNQTNVDKIVGKQSKAVENRIWMGIETTIPIATSRLPDIVVKPGAEDEQSQMDAQDHQDVLAYHFERVQIQAKAERFLRDMLVKRIGVFKIVWDKKGDDVGLRIVDPRRIRFPKFGTSVDDLAFLIEELEISYAQAVAFFDEKITKELFAEKGTPSENQIRKKTATVKEVWTNDFVVWATATKVLKKQENPYFDKDVSKNFFTVPKKPYIIKSLFETEESIIGDTDYISQLRPIQDNLNKRKRQLENLINKVGNPALLVDSDVMSEEEAANISNEEGIIIYGKDAAKGDKLRFEQPGQVPQYLFQDLESERREFDNIWGIHSTTRGEREGRETLGGRQLLREGDLGRIDLVARQLERALDEIAEYWTQLIKLFYTEEKSFSILGEDGVRFVKNFVGSKVGNGVKPMVKAGSTLKEDEFAIQQKAILLWQNKAIGLRTLYKMIKLPNMREAVDDFVETQSGQLLQAGQAGGVAPEAQVETGSPLQVAQPAPGL